MNKKCEYWWRSLLDDKANYLMLTPEDNHEYRHMMTHLNQIANYPEPRMMYMVNAADKINGGRKHKLKTVNQSTLLNWSGYVEVNSRDLYDLFQKENAHWSAFWVTVTEGWTGNEWEQFDEAILEECHKWAEYTKWQEYMEWLETKYWEPTEKEWEEIKKQEERGADHS